MKVGIYWILIAIFSLITLQRMNFEKNIFVFWATPMDSAPLIVRVSFEKLQIAADRDGWELHLISQNNIQDYLPDYQHFMEIVSYGHRQTILEKSDLLRIYLIEEHGGIWLDFSMILLQNLDWLTNQQPFDHLVINKVDNNVDDPEMLMFGESTHLSPYSYYNMDNRLISEEYFGAAIHFLASKRKSRAMTAWKKRYDDWVTKNYTEMMPDIMNQRYFVQNIYWEDVYVSANIAFETMIQEKQHQLDDNISLTEFSTPRRNVYQHFKIWQIHGQVGPIIISRHHLVSFVHFFSKTKQELQQKLGKLWFYVKINYRTRVQVINRQEKTEKYFTRHPEVKISDIIRIGPNFEQCKLFFIVKGSILHILFEESKYLKQIKAPFITVEQREILRRYCSEINPQYYTLEYDPSQPAYGQETKPQRQIKYFNMTSMIQKIQIIPAVYYKEINYFRQKWIEAFWIIITYLISRHIVILFKFIFSMTKKKLTFRQMFSLKNLRSKLRDRIGNYKWKYNLKQIGYSLLGIAFLFAKGFCYALNYGFYLQFDNYGFLGQWTRICVVIAINTTLDWIISKSIKQKSVNTFVNIQTILKETRLLLYFPIIYIAVLHMYIVYGFAYNHALNFLAGGLLVYAWLEEVKQRKVGFNILYKIKSVLSKSKWAFLALFLLYRLSRNFRYFRINSHYLKEYTVDLMNIGFWFLVYGLTISAFNFFCVQLYRLQSPQSSENQSKKSLKSQISDKKKNIIHAISTLIVILALIYNASYIIETRMQSPYTFNFLGFSRVLIGLYTICAALIRVKIKSNIVYGFILGIFSFIPILYIIIGESIHWYFEWRPLMRQIVEKLIIVAIVIIQQFKKKRFNEETSPKNVPQVMKFEVIHSSETLQSFQQSNRKDRCQQSKY